METKFFDLPIYRITQDQHTKVMNDKVEEYREAAREWRTERSQSAVDTFGQSLYDKYGPWQFNEVIGYIRLYILGSQIRGEHFCGEKKRNYLGGKRVFKWNSYKYVYEQEIGWAPRTNDMVWRAVQHYVERCKVELRRKNRDRFLDDKLLQEVGPHIDWISLMNRP